MTRTQLRLYFSAILVCLTYFCVEGSFKFNSLACEVINPELGMIKECAIKAIDRKHNMINIVAYLNKTIADLQVHFRLLKRESGGWHPFLYDMKFDACMFFRNRRKLFIPNLMYSYAKDFTNFNHTCPYLAGTEVSLLRWSPDEVGVLQKFPAEFGQYGMHTTWYSGKVPALEINGSVLYFK